MNYPGKNGRENEVYGGVKNLLSIVANAANYLSQPGYQLLGKTTPIMSKGSRVVVIANQYVDDDKSLISKPVMSISEETIAYFRGIVREAQDIMHQGKDDLAKILLKEKINAHALEGAMTELTRMFSPYDLSLSRVRSC